MMRQHLSVSALACVAFSVAAKGDEHIVSGDQGAVSIRWTYGGQRSMVTGEEAKAGIDGPWRVHVRVKNGDLVLFTDSTVVFENGLDEQNKVWEVSEFLNGTKGKVGPLTDLLHKSFYLNPGKAMVTAEPPLGAGQPMFLIRVKNLKAGQPVLFASGKVSHVPKAHGNKHFMFGALVLDPESK